jgi:glutathione synthase/RimK-type ligase-like ATP-grasp enzyme
MSQVLVVVNSPKEWPLHVPGVTLVAARAYLTDPAFSNLRGVRVFNLCRSYRYQSTGYYVSLLAAARGHRPVPGISTIQDLKTTSIVRAVAEDLDDLIQRSLHHVQSDAFTLSVYFGRNVAKRYDRLCLRLSSLFQAPLLRAQFARDKRWVLRSVGPISANEISKEHWPFVVQFAGEYFSGRRSRAARRTIPAYSLAILTNPSEPTPPSNRRAIDRFIRAAESLGLGVEEINRDDYGRLVEFDALFIRETTGVNHPTYRFARRAEAEGLVVIDDSQSILKCTNKVYLTELMNRHRLPTPKTVIVHRDNIETVVSEIGFPCILKQPDSSFSQGVVKVEERSALEQEAERLLDKSELVIAQEFLATPFDWRIGVLDRRPLFACRYHMARNHWQIVKHAGTAQQAYGKVDTLPIEDVPRQVVRLAVRSSGLIGNGLYGVDIKQTGRRCYVVEINENPNIDAGFEDAVLREELYRRVMECFLGRIEQLKRRSSKD